MTMNRRFKKLRLTEIAFLGNHIHHKLHFPTIALNRNCISQESHSREIIFIKNHTRWESSFHESHSPEITLLKNHNHRELHVRNSFVHINIHCELDIRKMTLDENYLLRELYISRITFLKNYIHLESYFSKITKAGIARQKLHLFKHTIMMN